MCKFIDPTGGIGRLPAHSYLSAAKSVLRNMDAVGKFSRDTKLRVLRELKADRARQCETSRDT